MPKKIMRKLMPSPEWLRKHKHLAWLHHKLDQPNLWHLNRRSGCGALAIGVFVAWLPIPLQMVLAAMMAITAGVNLPLAIVTVWITNPITIPFMFYIAYRLGSWLMGIQAQPFQFEFSIDWIIHSLSSFAPPLFLGSVILGLISGMLVYFVTSYVWQFNIRRHWRNRHNKHHS